MSSSTPSAPTALSPEDEKLVCKVLLTRYEQCVSKNFLSNVLLKGEASSVDKACSPLYADITRLCGSYIRSNPMAKR